MPETQALDERIINEVTQESTDSKTVQRPYHRPEHEQNGVHGDHVPELSAEEADYESFDGLENLIKGYKPADLDTIQKSLDIELSPFKAKEGNEHRLYINKEGTKLVKIDKMPVDDYQRLGREGVSKTLKEVWPDHFADMYDSPKIEAADDGEPTTGIIVEPIPKHPQFDQAYDLAQKGDFSLMDSINKHPFTEVTDACKEADLPFDFDSIKPDNYIITPEGKQVLVDGILVLPEGMAEEKDKIYALMTKRGDSTDSFARVEAYMAGLEALAKNKPTPEASDDQPAKAKKITQQYGRSMNQFPDRSNIR
jgi:hypothetical protein